ncbi:MAG: hypothetical protein ACI9LO_002198 [Planctomycetota bacterium]|jgi:hypothetical protein
MNYNLFPCGNIKPCLRLSHLVIYSIIFGKTTLEDSISSKEDVKVSITFFQLMKSTMSAFIGVQSNANRERDFKHGKISHFIGIGLLFGLIFVLTLIGVVQLVLFYTGN